MNSQQIIMRLDDDGFDWEKYHDKFCDDVYKLLNNPPAKLDDDNE